MESRIIRPLLRNIGSNLYLQLTASLIGLINYVLIARIFGPEGNGVFVMAFLLPNLLAAFLNLGVAPANVYHLGTRQVSPAGLYQSTLSIFILLAPIGFIIGTALLLWISTSLFPEIELSILLTGLLSFPLSLLITFLLSIYQGLQRFRIYNGMLVAQPLLLLLVLIMVGLIEARFILLIIIGHIMAQALVLCMLWILLRPLVGKFRKEKSPLLDITKKTLGYGWKAHLSNIMAFLNYKADIFLVNLFMGPAAVGIYAVAVSLGERLWILSRSVSAILLPVLADLSEDKVQRDLLTPLVARWVLAATALVALIMGLAAPPLIELIFGKPFLNGVMPLQILVIGIVFMAGSRVMANDIAARGKPELNLFSSLIVVTLNIIGNILLIPRYGLIGAASATSFAYTINMGIRLAIYSRLSGARWRDCLIIRGSDFKLIRSVLWKSEQIQKSDFSQDQ